jgi:hypothetical protein
VSRTSSAERDILVFFKLGGREAVCRVPPRRTCERFTLFVDMARLHLFDPVSERAIHPLRAPGRVAGDNAAMIPLRVSGEAAG